MILATKKARNHAQFQEHMIKIQIIQSFPNGIKSYRDSHPNRVGGGWKMVTIQTFLDATNNIL